MVVYRSCAVSAKCGLLSLGRQTWAAVGDSLYVHAHIFTHLYNSMTYNIRMKVTIYKLDPSIVYFCWLRWRKKWKDKLPSWAWNLGPGTGSSCSLSSHTFFPCILPCVLPAQSLTIQPTSYWETTLILCHQNPFRVNWKHISTRRGAVRWWNVLINTYMALKPGGRNKYSIFIDSGGLSVGSWLTSQGPLAVNKEEWQDVCPRYMYMYIHEEVSTVHTCSRVAIYNSNGTAHAH